MEPNARGVRETASPELTARAVVSGLLIGSVIASGTVYTALKTAFMDIGNLTSALIGFAVFSSLRRVGRGFSMLENNLLQTTAVSVIAMVAVTGVSGPIPALRLLDREPPWWAIVAWGMALGCIGVIAGAILRKKLVSEDKLPFPSGAATAEVIRAMFEVRGAALRRAGALAAMAVTAMMLTWLRDGTSWIAAAVFLPVMVAGHSATALGLGVSMSPLVLGTGALLGLHNAVSFALGGVVAWGVVAPWVLTRGIEATPDQLVNWLVWPAVGLMISSALTSFVIEWRRLFRGLRDVRRANSWHEARWWAGAAVLALSVAVVVLIGMVAFDMGAGLAALVVALAIVLATVCGRAAGETDLAPIGSFGAVTQLLAGAGTPAASISGGSVVAGVCSQSTCSLWSYRSGHLLGASPRAQLLGQLSGVVVGALVVVPVYFLVVAAYGLGTESMPSPGALTWRGTAEAIAGGGTLPVDAAPAAWLGASCGAVITVLQRYGWRWLPSPTAMSMGFVMPATFAGTVLIGAAVAAGVRARAPAWSERYVDALAAGAIVGESLMGLLLAAVIVFGIS